MIHKNRCNRRFTTRNKAKRKRKIINELINPEWNSVEWYKHFGQYRKGKIHCSCPICRAKTNHRQMLWKGNGRTPGGNNWKPSDRRRLDSMMDDIRRKEDENNGEEC